MFASEVLDPTVDVLAELAGAGEALEPGGCFVVEVIVPQLRRVAEGEIGRVFTLEDDHIGIATFDDVVAQLAGMRVRHRWGGWKREPFMADCVNQVVVFETLS